LNLYVELFQGFLYGKNEGFNRLPLLLQISLRFGLVFCQGGLGQFEKGLVAAF